MVTSAISIVCARSELFLTVEKLLRFKFNTILPRFVLHRAKRLLVNMQFEQRSLT